MKFTKFMLLLFGIGCFSAINAKTIFLEYDPACMDRYEYRYNGTGYGHIAYHIKTSDREKVILEIGIEKKVNQRVRPTTTVNCNEVSLNERVVRQINDGETQIFIIRRVGNQYNVSPVGIATYTQISNSFIGFVSVDYKFVYNYSQRSADLKNIASKNSESDVFYTGKLSNDCPRKLSFKKTKKRAGKNYSSIIMIPEIGIIEESTGFNKNDAENNRLILHSINNVPLERYVNTYCTDKGYNYPHASTFYSEGGRYTNTSPSDPNDRVWDLENNGGNTTTNSGNPTNDPYVGTSLCTIYKDLDRGIYIDRATGRPANGECGGNSYRDGYMVTGTTVVTGPSAPTVDSSPSTPSTSTPTPSTDVIRYGACDDFSRDGYHIVQKNETLYGIARLYGLKVNQIKSWNGLSHNLIKPCTKLYVRPQGTLANNNTGNVGNDTFTSKGNHVVKRGETIYQLAKLYGYTPDRFRQMNNLPNDVLYVGQRLRTSDCNCPNPNNIPASAESTGKRLVADSYDTAPTTRSVHIVKEDETIYSIARKYNINVEKLRSINNLEENEIIIPYQRLYVK